MAGQIQSLLSSAEFGHGQIHPDQAQALSVRAERIIKSALATKEFCS